MGDIADAILDGTFCSRCGETMEDVIDDDGPQGSPGLCGGCAVRKATYDVTSEQTLFGWRELDSRGWWIAQSAEGALLGIFLISLIMGIIFLISWLVGGFD